VGWRLNTGMSIDKDFQQPLQAQRGACRGLKRFFLRALIFVPNQIEVARRVLEDPLQRYLLADEVGMG